jgi:hypothetical protein
VTLIILQPAQVAKAAILIVNLLKMATDRPEVAKMPTPIPISGAGQEAVLAHAQINPLPVADQERPGQRNPAVSMNTAMAVVAAVARLRMPQAVAVALMEAGKVDPVKVAMAVLVVLLHWDQQEKHTP